MFKRNEVFYDELSKEAMEKNAKVYAKFNPYFATDTQVEITTIEQIQIYHKKLNGSRILGELLKDKQVPKRKRKKILKDLLKFWDKDFKETAEYQKKTLIERTTKIKRKRIKKIGYTYAFLFSLITILSILISQKVNYLGKLPFMGKTIDRFNLLLDDPMYHNLMILLIYLSFVSCIYLMILKSYFDIMRKVGHNAEAFIKDEFKKLHKRYVKQHKNIKAHLNRYMTSRRYKQKFYLKKIYDPNQVIIKLESYGKYIESKTDSFRRRYFWLRFFSIILNMSTIGLTAYLIFVHQTR